MNDQAARTPEDSGYRRAMLQLIAVGGSAVLASYLLAFDPEVGSNLWGGLPDGPVRQIYTVNMLLAAAGFFPATWWLVFATPASVLRERTGVGIQGLLALYAAILMASALWLPLTALYVADPSPIVWIAVRGVLLVTGFAATAVGVMLIRLAARTGRAGAWLAVFAFFFFWLQTMVLDALVWPHYYSLGS